MKTKIILLLTAVLLLTNGCRTPEPEIQKPAAADYTGTLEVEYEGVVNASQDIRVHFQPSEDGTTATLTIYKVKFVPQMPVTIDVTVPGITLTHEAGEFRFSGENIIPEAMGGPVERYRVTGLTGTQKEKTLRFNLRFGGFPTAFTGTKTP